LLSRAVADANEARKMSKTVTLKTVTHGALALALLAGASFVTAAAMAEPRETTRGIKPFTFFSPKADYRTDHRRRFANYRRGYYVSEDYERNAPPSNTPVRLNPDRRFYIGPHYKSRYGSGYHTNGPGIGIMR
jgi:hypothetical protein